MLCPICDAVIDDDSISCEVCLAPLREPQAGELRDEEELESRMRHPTSRQARRKTAAKSRPAGRRVAEPASRGGRRSRKAREGTPEKGIGLDDDVFVWESPVPLTEQVSNRIPEWTYNWVTRGRLMAIAAIIALATLASVLLSLPDSSRTKQAGNLGLAFTYEKDWTDVSDSPVWTQRFTLASRLVEDGATPQLVLAKGGAGLAILTRTQATDSAPPSETLLVRVEAMHVLYDLSESSRYLGVSETQLFGAKAYAVRAMHTFAGERRDEEVIVSARGREEVYVLMAAASDRWTEDRSEMGRILASAR